MKKAVSIFLVFGFLGGFWLFSVTPAPESTGPRPNIIYIMVDTLRADHLGIYGYERDTSPAIDSLARDGMLFKFAFTPAPWTPPSVASQLTGLYPASHNMLPPRSRSKAKSNSFKLSSKILTLPEMLKSYGYNTAGVSTNPWISSHYGFSSKFGRFEYLHRETAEAVNNKAYQMISELKAEAEPFFLYLHYLDPHNPYSPPGGYKKFFQGPLSEREYPKNYLRKVNAYDGEIKYLDDQLDRLFQFLKERDLYESSIIVFVSDHGEQFGEHGHVGHGYNLFNEEIHVPVILKLPVKKHEVVESPVSLIDLYPTILTFLEIPLSGKLQGVSLLEPDTRRQRPGIMASTSRYYYQKAFINNANLKLIVGEEKAYDDLELARQEVFNHQFGVFNYSQRPEPQVSLAANVVTDLVTILRDTYLEAKKLEVLPDANNQEIPDETLDELKSLGYF